MFAERSSKVEIKKYSLMVGLLAGFGFAFGSWGINSIALLANHGMYPLSKFLVGGLACILVGLLVGWLTWRVKPLLLNILVWVVTAVLLNRLALFITFPVQYRIIGWLNPAAQSLIQYPLEYGVTTRSTLVLIMMIVAGGLAGLLASTFVDEAATSVPFRRWMVLLVWMAAFVGIGVLGDSLNQKPMRDAVTVVNKAILFTLEHEGEDLDPQIQTRMGMRGLRSVSDYLHTEYRLLPAEYDQMMVFIRVLAKFGDTYAICSVINNSMGTCFLETQ
jgi:hypothetical protein